MAEGLEKEDGKMSNVEKNAIAPDSFRYFRTYYEASKMIGNDEARLRFYDAINEYVFLGEIPTFLGDESTEGRLLNMAWLLVKPVLDKSIGNSNGGRNSGGDRPSMVGNTNAQKQHVFNSQSSVEQLQNNTDKERDKDIGIGEGDKKRTSFVPPTLAEVSDYIREKGYAISAEKFIAYYESVGWMRGKTKIKDWRAAVRTWHTQEHTAQTRLHIPEVQPRKFMTADELGI